MTGQRGRPVNEGRQLALLTGEHHYEGKRCRACNSTTRYAKSGSCVECTKGASDRVRIKSKRKSKPSAPDDLSDILGTEPAKTVVAEQADDSASELPDCTPKEGVSPILPPTEYPGIIDNRGLYCTLQDTPENGGFEVRADDSADVPMASHGTEERIDDKPRTRYWCHPESGCVWTTPGTESTSDGLVEEISEDSYADLVKAGFTISVQEDDLDDILG